MDSYIRKYYPKPSCISVDKSRDILLPMKLLLGMAVFLVIFLETLALFLKIPLNDGDSFNYYSIRDIAIGLIYIAIGAKIAIKFYYDLAQSLNTVVRLGVYTCLIGKILHNNLLVNVALSSVMVFVLLKIFNGKWIKIAGLGVMASRLYFLTQITLMMGIFLVISGAMITYFAITFVKNPKYSLDAGLSKLGIVLLIGVLFKNYFLITLGISFIALVLLKSLSLKENYLSVLFYEFGKSAFYFYSINLLLLSFINIRDIPEVTPWIGLLMTILVLSMIYLSGQLWLLSLKKIKLLFEKETIC